MSVLNLTQHHPPQTVLLNIQVYQFRELEPHLPRLASYVASGCNVPLSQHPGWLPVLARGLDHPIYCLEATRDGKTCGLLGLAYVRSWLFGRFLVSLPYLNYGGVVAVDSLAAHALIDQAVAMADQLRVRYLELRHVAAIDHPALGHRRGGKVHMRLRLPRSPEGLWGHLPAKVRNLVRKGQRGALRVKWGGPELLPEFYAVFSENMRDLGTPVFGQALFQSALERFSGRAELCIIRAEERPVAAGLLLHGWGVSEVPSASCLRRYNHTNANMLLYWHLLERAIQRGQEVFDFGRSSQDSSTYRFKKQWGAVPVPAQWQYYVRQGEVGDMRPENPKYQRLIRLWQQLPVSVTRFLGPWIVRGIP
jgi:FemAB-related protein (PEP-CTERM system-associated)